MLFERCLPFVAEEEEVEAGLELDQQLARVVPLAVFSGDACVAVLVRGVLASFVHGIVFVAEKGPIVGACVVARVVD